MYIVARRIMSANETHRAMGGDEFCCNQCYYCAVYAMSLSLDQCGSLVLVGRRSSIGVERPWFDSKGPEALDAWFYIPGTISFAYAKRVPLSGKNASAVRSFYEKAYGKLVLTRKLAINAEICVA